MSTAAPSRIFGAALLAIPLAGLALLTADALERGGEDRGANHEPPPR